MFGRYALTVISIAILINGLGCRSGQATQEVTSVIFQLVKPPSATIRVQVMPGQEMLAFQVGNQPALAFFDTEGKEVGTFHPADPPGQAVGFYAWSLDSVALFTETDLWGYGPHGSAKGISMAGVYGTPLMDSHHPMISLDDRIYFLANNPEMIMADLPMIYRYNFHKHQTDGLMSFPPELKQPLTDDQVPSMTSDGQTLVLATSGGQDLLIYDLTRRTVRQIPSPVTGYALAIGYHRGYRRMILDPDAQRLVLQAMDGGLREVSRTSVPVGDYDPEQSFIGPDGYYLCRKEQPNSSEVAFDRIAF